jgi:TonB-linked SusC/RagA family outer membrane protein
MECIKKCFATKTFFWKVMKITAVQCLLALIFCGMTIAHHSDAQVLDRRVTLSLQGVPVEKMLAAIERASSVKIFYSSTRMRFGKEVSMHVINSPLRNVLDSLLTPLGISYNVHEKEATITLSRGEAPSPSAAHDSSMISLSPPAVIVSGKVTDATSQQPLAGVNILVKGTAKGTTTDGEGKFSIEVNEEDVLLFSFIGYAGYETRISGRTVIDVALAEDIQGLNEVVINAGYWEVKEKQQTGSIASLSAEEIKDQPVSNPLAAMEGKMPGVFIQQTTGMPGGGFNIQIRGRNSIRNDIGNNGNLPLYIVDGIPFPSASLNSTYTSSSNLNYGNPLSTINPNDIESIEVLKDADATAIYGSRGANGVVLITTKKGKAGKTKVELETYSGIGQVTRKLSLLNTPQYLQMRKEAFRNDGQEITPYDYDINGVWDTTRYTNWQKKLIGGTAHITSAQASASGGDANTQFVAGGRYYRESTVFPSAYADQKASAHFSFNHVSPSRKLNLAFSSSYLFDHNRLPGTDMTQTAMTLPPDAPEVYTSGNKLNWENSTWSNPYADLLRKYKANTANLISNAIINYHIAEGLSAKANIGYTDTRIDEVILLPVSALDPRYPPLTGSSVMANAKVQSWIAEPQLHYERGTGIGKFNVMMGSTFQQTTSDRSSLLASGFTSDALLENIKAATNITTYEYTNSQYRYAALFGRINYNWNDKYIVNLTGRRDGSTRFSPDHRFASFGAVGAAWIFSNENFVAEHLPFLSFGKLRSSYGVTGSDQIPNYGYLDTYSATTYQYTNNPGLIPTRVANPDFGWEINKKLEAALEWGLFKDRLGFSVSAYRNRSSNQLVGYSLPGITGFSSVQYNLPATVQNTGLELSVNAVMIKNEKWKWSGNVNLTLPRNKLVSYPNLAGSDYQYTYEVGKSLYIKKQYHFMGIDKATGNPLTQDVNKDNAFTPADLLALRQVGQRYYGGVQQTLSYSGWQLNVFVQYVKQSGYNFITHFPIAGRMSNQPAEVLHRWQAPGDDATYQKFTAGFNPSLLRFRQSDYTISDASFIRLKNVALSYQLPSAAMDKIGLQSLKVYALAQNLFTITRYKGLDPETQSSIVLPPLRVITLGIQIGL